MSDEIKYCKFCNKEKPIKEFVKSGFAIKNICRECQNKKQAQIYRDSKKVKELEKENQELKKQLEVSEKARKEAIETIKKHLEAKTYGNHKYELFGREYLEEILKILDIDKGE